MPPCDTFTDAALIELKSVSILVLVDAALRLVVVKVTAVRVWGFNPCFSGCRPATYEDNSWSIVTFSCFNPCFSGCRPATSRQFGSTLTT